MASIEVGDFGDAYKRFSQILEKDADNANAWIGKGISIVGQKLPKSMPWIEARKVNVDNVVGEAEGSLKMAKKLGASEENLISANAKIGDIASEFLYAIFEYEQCHKNQLDQISPPISDQYVVDNLIKIFDKYKKDDLRAMKAVVELKSRGTWVFFTPDIDGLIARIKAQDPNYTRPKKQGGGCFIATAAFGSEFADEVSFLRTWRDDVLLPHAIGRAFVDLYYWASPCLADMLRKCDTARLLVRRLLGALIEVLRRIPPYRKV